MLRALCTKRRGPWSAKDEKRAWRPCSPKKMSPQCHWACIWCVEDEMVCFTENAKLPLWEASSGHHYVHGASWESHLRDLEFDRCDRDKNYIPEIIQPQPIGELLLDAHERQKQDLSLKNSRKLAGPFTRRQAYLKRMSKKMERRVVTSPTTAPTDWACLKLPW